MATMRFPAQRLILAGGFAVAVAAAPAVAVFAAPGVEVAPVAQSCSNGEEPDQFTGICIPHTVPKRGQIFTTPAGNPDIPEVMGIPCTGANTEQCIGLAEEQQASTVTAPPAPVFSHSP